MIIIDNLAFHYSRKKHLYNNLNLKLQKGNIYGLLGKNGAGKSTLLKLICGLLFPRSGMIAVNGYAPGKRLPSFLQTIYLIPEEVYVPAVTIKKYLDLYAVFYPLFDEKQFREYLAILDVHDEGKLTSLSFGQQKKFIIAFALACNTEVLILDELTNGLDIPSKLRFRKLMASVMDRDRIILISTHQVRDLDNLIDHIVVVEDGRLLVDASIEAISEQLSFKTVEEPPAGTVYYAEESFRGTCVVTRNECNEHTKVNLEHLFNAVCLHPGISELLTPPYIKP